MPSLSMASRDEHIIKCSICNRGLIIKDIVNNGVAFLSHLKLDHGITYIPQRMVEEQIKSKNRTPNQMYITSEEG
ncbi:MAG: hypothetical protein WBL67_06455 [Nitrososphaeraceae archaeon]|jgi:hypothetical protein